MSRHFVSIAVLRVMTSIWQQLACCDIVNSSRLTSWQRCTVTYTQVRVPTAQWLYAIYFVTLLRVRCLQDYLTALHVAAHCGNVRSAEVLLNNCCTIDATALVCSRDVWESLVIFPFPSWLMNEIFLQIIERIPFPCTSLVCSMCFTLRQSYISFNHCSATCHIRIACRLAYVTTHGGTNWRKDVMLITDEHYVFPSIRPSDRLSVSNFVVW